VSRTLELLRAFFLRDMRIALSYKAGFALGTMASIGNIAGLFFLGQAFGDAAASRLDAYGGSYFAFVIVGVAFTNFMALGLGGLASKIREGQMMGTLELMLISPNRLAALLLSSSLWSHAYGSVSIVLYFVIGAALGMDLGDANVPVVLVSLLLAIVSFNALGLLAASVVIVIKQGDPVNWVVGVASVLLAGVFYPRDVLPSWLQAAGNALPLTHALELVRRSALQGAGFDALWPSFIALVVLTSILVPLGLFACHLAVRVAQTDGSLSQY
jgi:ABC-2 type transport system permease protein